MNDVALERAYQLCLEKVRRHTIQLPGYIKEYEACTYGNYYTENPDKVQDFLWLNTWTASFFTGMAVLAFETEKDFACLKWANRQFPVYYQKVFHYPEETMHDLGFLYSPYSVALYRLTGDVQNRMVAIKAADELAKRYSVDGGYLRAWGRMDDLLQDPNPDLAFQKGLAIIDTMMNLPLLFWATETTGNRYYRQVAMHHADTTLRCFIRPDASVYHAYRFDPLTGQPLGGANYCGYAEESHWARGTAWAIYGFALAYRYTRQERYLDAAVALGQRFVDNLDASWVPPYDFRLPAHEAPEKDTSAAAITACGFMEILSHRPQETRLENATREMLHALTRSEYLDDNVAVPGVLKQSNGRRTYTIFGDYFFMEALARSLRGVKGCW